jgi:hypothetical protein
MPIVEPRLAGILEQTVGYLAEHLAEPFGEQLAEHVPARRGILPSAPVGT